MPERRHGRRSKHNQRYFDPVKHFRLWLLLLLAVLLPMRGAFAAAMFCPPAGVGTQSEVRAPGHAAGQHATADVVMDDAAHDPVTHDHGSNTGDGESLSTQDKCNLCSAFCSVAAFVGSLFTMPTPQDLAAAAFPDPFAPPPSFLSDGQDRPPRSI